MLEAREVCVSFGGVRAVDHVSLTLDEREILGVIGPNGSGKTTLLNALTGVVKTTGSLRVDGEDVGLGSMTRSRRAGIVRMFQAPQTVDELTCLENVLLSTSDSSRRGLLGATFLRRSMGRHERARWQRASEALDFVGLRGVASQSAADLTYGQRRLIDLARVVAADASVVLLDEPSAGLNDHETTKLADLCLELRSQGMAVIVVEHKIDFVDRLCDRIMVLELGRVVAEGPPDVVWKDQRVMDAYLGVPRA